MTAHLFDQPGVLPDTGLAAKGAKCAQGDNCAVTASTAKQASLEKSGWSRRFDDRKQGADMMATTDNMASGADDPITADKWSDEHDWNDLVEDYQPINNSVGWRRCGCAPGAQNFLTGVDRVPRISSPHPMAHI